MLEIHLPPADDRPEAEVYKGIGLVHKVKFTKAGPRRCLVYVDINVTSPIDVKQIQKLPESRPEEYGPIA